MKILKLITLIAIVFAMGSCTSDSLKPGDGVFSGSITGAENQQLFMRKETSNNPKMDTILVGADGSFSFNSFLEKPEYFTLFVGRNQVLVYLRPGDSIKFNADIQYFNDAKFSGSSVVYNNYLVSFAKSQSEFAQSMQVVFKRPEAEAVAVMDSLRTAQMNALHEVEENFSKVDKFFIETEKSRIKYFWGLSHVMYPLYYSYYNNDKGFKTSPEFDSYLGELNINDSNLISLPDYRQFIFNYLNSKVNGYFEDESISASNPSFTSYQLGKIDEIFTDKNVKSYLAYRVMRDHVSYDGIKDYDLIWPIFDKICTSPFFKDEIVEALASWNYLKPGNPAQDFAGVTLQGDTVHLSDFIGKYVYVDVWATWCRPCLGEIPALTRIEEEMKDNNIVFISASVDRDKGAWDKMLTEQTMHGVQIYVGQSETLSGFYKISSIPRFMLFDREGKILEVSADRPTAGVDKKLLMLEGI